MDVSLTNQEAEQPGSTINTATDDVIPRNESPANGVLKRRHYHHRGVPPEDFIHPGDASYKECMKNHAASIGGHALDGCLEFMPSPADPKSLTCDACSCHRNFHRLCRPADGTHRRPVLPIPPCLIDFQPLNRHQPPPPPLVAVVPLAAVAPPRNPGSPSPPPISSTYYSAATRLPTATNNSSGHRSGQRKRFRTKFSPVQKEKMLEFAERVGWRMQRSDVGNVRDFCKGIGVDRNVFKVWMHNNKNTLRKKTGGAITTNGAIGDFTKDDDDDGDLRRSAGGVPLGKKGSPSSS